jgi:hypothetical protein
MTTRCFIGVDVEEITEALEAFIVPPVKRDNINTEDMIDDNNLVIIRSEYTVAGPK